MVPFRVLRRVEVGEILAHQISSAVAGVREQMGEFLKLNRFNIVAASVCYMDRRVMTRDPQSVERSMYLGYICVDDSQRSGGGASDDHVRNEQQLKRSDGL